MKQRRLISMIAAIAMLLTMSVVALPASAEVDTLAMYTAIANDAATDPNGLADAIAGGETDAAALAAKATGMTFKEDAKPRVAWTAAYTTAGYKGTNWSISEAEDWLAMVSGDGNANAASQQVLHSYYVTNDIDFDNTEMLPIACFRGNIYGQNHTFKKVNIVQKGNGITNNNGAALASRTGAGAAGAQVIQDLGVTGKVTSNTGDATNKNTYAATFIASNENVTLTNCWSAAEISITNSGATKGNYYGGLVAYSNKPISDCTFSGKITVACASPKNDWIGGIVGGTIAGVSKCVFNGTIIDTGNGMNADGDEGLGGIVGRTNHASNAIVDNCISLGTISSVKGSATGLVGSVNRAGIIYNSISAATLTAPDGFAAAFKDHSNVFSDVANWKPANVYAVGHNFLCVRGSITSDLDYNGHKYNLAGFNGSSKYKAGSAAEAAWKVMNNYAGGKGAQVLYTLNENGVVTFSKQADGADRIRKVSFTGALETPLYLNAGTTNYDLNTLVSGVIFELTEGSASTIVDGKLNLGNEDITINVKGNVADPAAYAAAKKTLEDMSAAYAAIAPSSVSNADAIAAAKSTIDAALAADKAESTVTTQNAIINLAKDPSIVVTPALAEGKYVPYAAKNFFAATTVYGIYSEADWMAAVAAGNQSGNTLHLMENITLTAADPAFAEFNGTFDGHEKTITVAINKNVASGAAYGLFGKNGTVKNLIIDGTAHFTVGSAETPVSGRTYAAVFSGYNVTLDNCVNKATVTAEAYGTNRLWIGGMGGEVGTYTNCVNKGNITVTGCSSILAVGGIGGRTNMLCSNLTNEGDITVYDDGTTDATSSCVGGIFGSSAGNDMINFKNTGTITVMGGYLVYAGGIQGRGTGASNTDYVNGAVNEGNVDVSHVAPGASVYAGGIFGGLAWPMMGTISNSGNITADVRGAATAMLGGITADFDSYALEKTSVEGLSNKKLTATNSGKIWLGGVKEASDAYAVSQITPSTQVVQENCVETGSAEVCGHNIGSSDPILESENTHADTCGDCSFVEIVECAPETPWVHNNDLVYDNGTITATHSATCGCGRTITASCVASELLDPVNDCTADSFYMFECCDREAYVVEGSGENAHNFGEWEEDPNDPTKEIRHCLNNDGACEGYESRTKVGITVAVSGAAKAGKEVKVTITLIGALTEATFTLDAEGYTVSAVEGKATAEGNAVRLTEAAAAGETIVVTLMADRYAVVEAETLAVTTTAAKNAEGDAEIAIQNATIDFERVEADADADGEINLVDAIMALRYSVGLTQKVNTANANMNGDAVVNAADALAIVRYWLENN